MSGFVCSMALGTTAFTSVKADPPQGWDIEYIEFDELTEGEEAAGKVGRVIGVVAAIFVPFAGPALWTALTTSGGLLSGLAGAASSTFGAALTNTVGSALVSGALNAGAAYLGGARGADVWQAFGSAAISQGVRGGLSAITGGARAAGAAASAAHTPVGPTVANVAGATNSTAGLAGVTNTTTNLAADVTQAGAGAANASTLVSNPIASGIRSILGNIDSQMMRQASAALINAAVNGGTAGRLDSLVDAQRAELDALAARDRAVYDQRIAQAQTIIAEADRADPAWRGRMAMADVAGMEANQARQTMRNIATRQGNLDAGQRNAYARSAGLHTARSKALAYNRGFSEAEVVRNQARAAGAALLGPNDAAFRHWQAGNDLEAGRIRAQHALNSNTAGLFADAFFGSGNRIDNQAPSPVPGSEEDDEDNIFGGGQFGRRG